MIVLIDNYDSFTFNLEQLIAQLGFRCSVHRNDTLSCGQLADLRPQAIVLSPGPGRPRDAGVCLEVIARFAGAVPILGVCLGHQAIGEAFGGKVVRGPVPMHGKVSAVRHFNTGLFAGLSSPLFMARYHSLVVDRKSLPACLEVTAESEDGLVMALSHRELPVHGVQFHPESFASERGPQLLQNFLRGVAC